MLIVRFRCAWDIFVYLCFLHLLELWLIIHFPKENFKYPKETLFFDFWKNVSEILQIELPCFYL